MSIGCRVILAGNCKTALRAGTWLIMLNGDILDADMLLAAAMADMADAMRRVVAILATRHKEYEEGVAYGRCVMGLDA